MFRNWKSLIFVLCLAFHPQTTWADFVAFSDFASFSTATTGAPFSVVNFDSASPNTIIGNGSTFQGITFQYSNVLATNLVITNGVIGSGTSPLPTTSGTQFLGNTGSGQLVASLHDMTLSFSNTSAVGMRLIVRTTADPATLVGDIRFSTSQSGVTAQLPSVQSSNLVDGAFTDRVYFLGLQNTSGTLNNLSITTPNSVGPDFSYRIDDIFLVAVPEPNSMVLLLSAGALAMAFGIRRRFSTSPK